MIIHMAVFNLRHAHDSEKEQDFIRSIGVLSDSAGVQDFRVWRQTAADNKYRFGISMMFQTRDDFDAYVRDEGHRTFSRTRWKPEVTETVDINFEPVSSRSSSV